MNARSIKGYEVKRAVISENTAANNEIVAAVTGKRIVVSDVTVVCTVANALTWKSAATALGGMAHSSEYGLFETAAGEALNLTQDGTDQVSGYVVYIEQVETL